MLLVESSCNQVKFNRTEAVTKILNIFTGKEIPFISISVIMFTTLITERLMFNTGFSKRSSKNKNLTSSISQCQELVDCYLDLCEGDLRCAKLKQYIF